jgi:membrane protein
MKLKNFNKFLQKEFLVDFSDKILKDDIFTGAAALAYYLLLSIFPAMIFLLSLMPFLPIKDLDVSIMSFIREALPSEAAKMFSGVVQEVTSNSDGRLVSFGFLAALWAASTGMYAIMQQLNKTYDVPEARSILKGRGLSIFLTISFGLLVLIAFSLIIFGGFIQTYLDGLMINQELFAFFFQLLRWFIIVFFILLGISLIYYFGPNIKQKFTVFTPGSIVGVILLILSSLGFRYYVGNFANYAVTYGSIGAVIILIFWLYIVGVILLFGSEVNAILNRENSVKNKE